MLFGCTVKCAFPKCAQPSFALLSIPPRSSETLLLHRHYKNPRQPASTDTSITAVRQSLPIPYQDHHLSPLLCKAATPSTSNVKDQPKPLKVVSFQMGSYQMFGVRDSASTVRCYNALFLFSCLNQSSYLRKLTTSSYNGRLNRRNWCAPVVHQPHIHLSPTSHYLLGSCRCTAT